MLRQKPLLGELPDWARFPKPISLWLMNEGTAGKIVDLSGNGNDGAIRNGAPVIIGGKYGSCIKFDAASDINCGNSGTLNPSSEVSVECWVMMDSAVNYGRIFDRYPTLNLDFRYNGSFPGPYIGYKIGGTNRYIRTAAATTPTGQWCQIAATIKSGYQALYLNGKEIANAAHSGTLDTQAVDFIIGADQSGNYDADGKIHHLTVFDCALSAEQVARLYFDPFPWFVEDEVSHIYVPAGGPPSVKPYWYYHQMTSVMRRTG